MLKKPICPTIYSFIEGQLFNSYFSRGFWRNVTSSKFEFRIPCQFLKTIIKRLLFIYIL